ncbi:uncharacterized protein A1O5_11444 [Cladophialophora psammophila CBS 110553]|uniref:Uncharacterized protein n=1 Tax=Cladophialophora psammophila CBS 110553 TaxID=1182543 RepID=W9WEI4_9EURO|nr:uncharacterized protein A1O5_11444 [Cladophialophora psammophila CBS 110553]EXJ63395.1 hypothetical protein A1O5_11444 [Cladophialophora psammophila CBS 110553]
MVSSGCPKRALIHQVDFKLGPKDGKCHFQQIGPYQIVMSAVERMLVVLYDTADKRVWLVPASEVILDMCQHRKQLEHFMVGGSPVVLPPAGTAGQSAIDVLLENALLDL